MAHKQKLFAYLFVKLLINKFFQAMAVCMHTVQFNFNLCYV